LVKATDTVSNMPLRRVIVHASSVFINIVLLVAEFMACKCNQKHLQNQQSHLIPYHMSLLSGEGWIQELMSGHPIASGWSCCDYFLSANIFRMLTEKCGDGGGGKRRWRQQ
jgi:hypothetical protein